MSLSGWRWPGGAAESRGQDRRAGQERWRRPSPLPLTRGWAGVLVEGPISLCQRIVQSKCLGGELSPLAESPSSVSLGQKGWLPPRHACDVLPISPPPCSLRSPHISPAPPSLQLIHHPPLPQFCGVSPLRAGEGTRGSGCSWCLPLSGDYRSPAGAQW